MLSIEKEICCVTSTKISYLVGRSGFIDTWVGLYDYILQAQETEQCKSK